MEEPLDLRFEAVIVQLRRLQTGSVDLGDGVAVVEELRPRPQSLHPIEGINAVQISCEVPVDL